MATVTDPTPWISALRASHDRLSGIVAGLDSDGLRAQSYDTEWKIADVLSHLGSGAEIFRLVINAGATGGEPPAREDMQKIWDRWNAMSPEEQAVGYLDLNDALLARIDEFTPEQAAAFQVTMFGPVPFDLAGVLGMRLGEHALHTWDIAVVLDRAARVSPDAVDLMVDGLAGMAGFLGKKAAEPVRLAVTTTAPERAFTLDTGGVSLAPAAAGDATAASLSLPAEAFLRLLTGRLDDDTELTASGVTLPELKTIFPGF